jgi:hypothetical protein
VRHGVDEGVVLIVAAQLAHQKHGVDDDAGDDEGEGEDTEDERKNAAAVDENPADVERDGRRNHDDTERHENDGSGTTPGHRLIVVSVAGGESSVVVQTSPQALTTGH